MLICCFDDGQPIYAEIQRPAAGGDGASWIVRHHAIGTLNGLI